MTKLTENDIELWAIEELQSLGWEYLHGAIIAPDGDHPERSSFGDVVLRGRLQSAIDRNNPEIPLEARQEALKNIERIAFPDLMVNNQAFHEILTEGFPVTYRKDGVERGNRVQLVNFENPEQNDFLVVNQFTIIENNTNKRPDLILFVNGLPLVLFELKNAIDEHATLESAYHQIQTYKGAIPSLFSYNAFCILSDGADARAGSLSAGFTRYMAWKTSDGLEEASTLTSQLEVLIKGLLNPGTLLDFIRHFIVFEKSGTQDPITKQLAYSTQKKIAAYHQYYAVNKAIESVKEASSNSGDRKGGVVWHTQGSGKSLSMVFFSGKLVLQLNNPTIVVITDRNDLDDQLFDTFAASKQLLRQVPVQAESREHLKELLKVASGGIVFATIQKFQPEDGTNVYEQLSDRTNIVVVADEAHRTQYGFKPKAVDVKDDGGNVVGQRLVYGFAKYMRDALPNATYLGFTGTPIESTDVNTPAVFGHYVDIYDIARAVDDGATVPIYYESRLVKINLSEEGQQLIEELDAELGDGETIQESSKMKWTKVEAIIGSQARLQKVAEDIVFHYEERTNSGIEGKAMVVAMSRRIAVDLYNEIIKIRPHWHSDKLDKGAIKVVMTAASSDGPELMKHHTTKEQRRSLADRMKDTADPLRMVIVRDMWLTGFDAPSLHTLYIDKPMKGHNLMQAIARVNRVYKDKPGGLVVDYFGIASDLKKALSFYSESGGKGDPAEAQEKAVGLMLEKLEVVSQMFSEKPAENTQYAMAADDRELYGKSFAYENYFDASVRQKLEIILAAVEHILSLEDGKDRFVREVTALSKAFAIALPHEEAMDAKDEIAFFQAVKARLMKFEPTTGGKSNYEIETAIKQVIDQAIVSEQVVDIFDAAGIKKPELSVLDDEFLEEMRDMKHKNLALEVLKKLLNDEIKLRARHNVVQSRSLMEMLESSIKRYQNNLISAAEIIQEMIDLAKEIKEADKRGEKLGLSMDELAFYDAVASNESAKDLLGDDVLLKLARVLVERVKANASIDWTVKESVRKKLKVVVKRTLRQYGYPPDMQKLATETVLQQAETLAEFWN
ncbi:type I restriction endonuclease subunit R [Marinilabilia salmonicolor]|uniref:type I restriction endonuclease subunit R n=1 Tax=Marinilabilia salmonicolor TaxID=989 RepID=UPI00029AEC86|nr:type I restriction endonuclease subunit R [Marinilabilia salmonicolor]